jgi:oligoendopeptidase F
MMGVSSASARISQRQSIFMSNKRVARTCDEGPQAITDFIDEMNEEYERKHVEFENNFWSTKMALDGASNDELNRTKEDYEAFLRQDSNLKKVRELIGLGTASAGQQKVLEIMKRTFECYIMEGEEAVSIRQQITKLETTLEHKRSQMKLGYTHAGKFITGSSVLLRTKMRTDTNEGVRKACYDGLRSIGPFVLEELCEIVKLRNSLARKLGYEDFYAYKVLQAEGFSKIRLFEILDELEKQSKPLLDRALAALAKQYGDAALEPWNTQAALSGEVARKQDPYFPFDCAVERWGRSFSALGIRYQGATMTLDLLDRKGKYSNGFCHWPQPAYFGKGGKLIPSRANFTSLATPSAVGSGLTGLTTLMHEGGHAAHFANIRQESPFFSQERAPTSVAYAENQSMFLDSLVQDAAWIGRYATSKDGVPMPWELLEEKIRATHEFEVLSLRSMLSVPYFEKALYELADDELTAANVASLADDVELRLQGGLASRPLLSVPHILSDEASCYYHGYVLAEMSVQQTRGYFLQKYGTIVDEPRVGQELADVYWAPGNSELFLDLVQRLTGEPLTPKAWIEGLKEDLDEKVKGERVAYDEAVAADQSTAAVELGMRMMIVHGGELVADTEADGSFEAACGKFKEWVGARGAKL